MRPAVLWRHASRVKPEQVDSVRQVGPFPWNVAIADEGLLTPTSRDNARRFLNSGCSQWRTCQSCIKAGSNSECRGGDFGVKTMTPRAVGCPRRLHMRSTGSPGSPRGYWPAPDDFEAPDHDSGSLQAYKDGLEQRLSSVSSSSCNQSYIRFYTSIRCIHHSSRLDSSF